MWHRPSMAPAGSGCSLLTLNYACYTSKPACALTCYTSSLLLSHQNWHSLSSCIVSLILQENWLKGCCALLVCAEDGDPPEGSLDDYGLGEPLGVGAGSSGAATGQQQQEQLRMQRRVLQLGPDADGDAELTGPLGPMASARGSEGWPDVEGEEEGEGDSEGRSEEWEGDVEAEVAGSGMSRRRLAQLAQAQMGALKKWPGRPVQRGRCPFRTSK